MLVLSRQRDQAILIGDPDAPLARIAIVDIRGDKVRLGIDAGRSIQIHRAEVAGRILAEARDSSTRSALIACRDQLLSEVASVELQIQKLDAAQRASPPPDAGGSKPPAGALASIASPTHTGET